MLRNESSKTQYAHVTYTDFHIDNNIIYINFTIENFLFNSSLTTTKKIKHYILIINYIVSQRFDVQSRASLYQKVNKNIAEEIRIIASANEE